MADESTWFINVIFIKQIKMRWMSIGWDIVWAKVMSRAIENERIQNSPKVLGRVTFTKVILWCDSIDSIWLIAWSFLLYPPYPLPTGSELKNQWLTHSKGRLSTKWIIDWVIKATWPGINNATFGIFLSKRASDSNSLFIVKCAMARVAVNLSIFYSSAMNFWWLHRPWQWHWHW